MRRIFGGVRRPKGDVPSGADPSGADPSGADPSGADPSGADPSRADLSRADLSAAGKGGAAGRVRYLDILRIPSVRVVILGTFVIMLGWGIVAPALPLYARSFNVGYDAVGLLIASFAFTRLLFDLVAGPIVQRFGERPVVVWGSVVVGLSSVMAALAPTFPLLVLFRGLGGAGSAVFFAAIMAFLLRTSPKEYLGRVMGVFFGAFNLGVICGQPVGGLIADAFGLASPLWAYGAACFVAAGLYQVTLSPPDPDAEKPPRVKLRSLRWNRPFITVLASNTAYFWMIAGVWSTLIPLFGKERVGLSEIGVGLALAVASAAEFVVLFNAGSLTDKLGRKAVMVPSFAGMAIAVAAFGLAEPVTIFFIGMAVLGVTFGYGGIPAPVMLSDITPEEHSPTAIGVYRFVGDLGFVLGPLLAGGAASLFGFEWAFALSAIPAVVALGLLLSIPDTRPAPEAAVEGAPALSR